MVDDPDEPALLELIELLKIIREELGTQIHKLQNARHVRRYRNTTGRLAHINQQQVELIQEALKESKMILYLVKEAS